MLSPVHPSVRVHEYVDDLELFYQIADVFIVPLFAGSGIRLKILDALNHGVPVVSTRAGYAGIELEESNDICVGDTPAIFAEKISKLIGNREKRETLARMDEISWQHGIENGNKAIEDLLIQLDTE